MEGQIEELGRLFGRGLHGHMESIHEQVSYRRSFSMTFTGS